MNRLRNTVSAVAALLCAGFAAGYALSQADAAVKMPGETPDPEFVKPVIEEPAKGTRVNVDADRLTYDSKRKIATATGTVRIVYGPYVLTATKVVYDIENDVFKANGSVELREPNGNVLQADYSEINNKFKEGFANHVIALLNNDVTITADYAKRTMDGITVYERATYTACKTCLSEDGTPAWRIVAKRATHDEIAKTIYYDDPTFEIGGVPVMWLPYLESPDPTVKRRTGFLPPSASYGKPYGPGLTIPYFWALAPNADLTFSPRWTVWQGLVADVEWRHRLRDGIYDLKAFGVHQFDRSKVDDNSRWRGALQSKGEFEINPTWSWGWEGTLASDKTFLDDYDFDDRNMITSDVHITGLSDRSYVSTQALHYQTMLTMEDQDELPVVLPYVTASHIFGEQVLGGEVGLGLNVYSLSRDEVATDYGLGTDQTRGVADINWHRQMIGGMGQVFTPFMRLRGDVYINENVPDAESDDETTAHLLPSAGVDMRWPFIAAEAMGQSVVTPVFQIIAAGDVADESDIATEDSITLNFDHTNLFLQERNSGLDRYDTGTRANAGLLYSFLFNNGGFARMSIGESFHVAGENSFLSGSGLDGPVSDLVGALAFQPSESLRFTYEARAEEDLSRINSQEASVSLTLDRITGSLSYADIGASPFYGRTTDEEQIWGDAAYRLDEAWSLFGGLRYDVREDRFMDKFVGIHFDCDCMKASISYAESISNDQDEKNDSVDRSIKLSVELRTLGRVSGGFGF